MVITYGTNDIYKHKLTTLINDDTTLGDHNRIGNASYYVVSNFVLIFHKV